MATWRSGGGRGGGGRGARVAVEEEREWWRSEELSAVAVKNWKSLRRRSAHLLAEQVAGMTLEGFLGGATSLEAGVQRPMPTCRRASISNLCA